ncbi:MAG: glycosyltransferase family 2 protein [Candidatus Dormibacteria bacterium]
MTADRRRSTISAVLVTRNEAALLDECLARIEPIADEIIVMDLESTDGTPEVAARHGATVLRHSPVPHAELVLGKAIEHATSEWILVIAPDEWFGSDLVDELRRIVADDACDVVYVPFVNSIFGRELHAPGAAEPSHPRLFRKERVQWPTRIHTEPDLRGLRCHSVPRPASGSGTGMVAHVNWRTSHQVLEKFSRYVQHEAERRHGLGTKFGLGRMIYRLSREFGGRYVLGRCYEDGLPGFFFAAMYGAYELGIQIELWQLEGSPARQDRWIKRSGRVLGEPVRWILPLWMRERRRRSAGATSMVADPGARPRVEEGG